MIEFRREVEAAYKQFARTKVAIATKYAKYKVGETIKHTNWPESRSKTCVIESVCVERLEDYVICYWVTYKNGRFGQVYESEIIEPKKKK